MKKFICSWIVLVSSVIWSQTGTIGLNWGNLKSEQYGDVVYQLPSIEQRGLSFIESSGQIVYNGAINAANLNKSSVISWTNLSTEAVSKEALGAIKLQNLPQKFDPNFELNKDRNTWSATVHFNPFYRENGQILRVISFQYAVQTGTLKNSLINNVFPVQNSVLATGDWFRFFVTTSGIHKISKDFLRGLGMSVDGIDPRNIAIYGSGGRMLPLSNAAYYPFDLTENAIMAFGESDGNFDDGDFFYFYAEGLDHWDEDNQTHLNIYSDKAYYYVTNLGVPGKRMRTLSQPSSAASQTFTAFDDYRFHEIDLSNIGKLGRVWFGEFFGITADQEFNFAFPALTAGSQPQLNIHFGANAVSPTVFTIQANGQTVGTSNLAGLGDYLATESYFSATLVSSGNINLKLSYNNNGIPTAKSYLDYIKLSASSDLKAIGKQFPFQINPPTLPSGVVAYQFSSTAGLLHVWDITDPYQCSYLPVPAAGGSFTFKTNAGLSSRFVAFDPNDLYEPQSDHSTRVANQNLKGSIFKNQQGQFEDIDYLIITPRYLAAQAEDLAEFHRSNFNLKVRVVSLESIYHEFSSGKQDVAAIRNFIKYVYFNASDPSKQVKYVNLFGDASYDYKDRLSGNTNIVPIYHSINGLTKGESSFSTDDFYGLMDENEGNINDNGAQKIDVAPGRMLVTSTTNAAQMVTKIKQYHESNSYGSWRNSVTYISDDPDSFKIGDRQLQFYQNRLADRTGGEKPFLNIKKILLDSYVQESSSGGDRYPEAKREIFNAFEKGSLVFNYLGHGGEDGLANERIWDLYDGQNLNNQYKYPLFVTITCDFSRFDDPQRISAGELTYMNPSGGAIAMITTVRAIGQSSAQYFNDDLAESLFPRNSSDYPTIGEALRLTKNLPGNLNTSRNVVTCLGDPALHLAIPKMKVVLTKINGVPISQAVDTFKALSLMQLEGEIQSDNGTTDTSFNGELAVQIFDKNNARNTLRNDNVDAMITINGQTATNMPFTTLGETIFKGNASVSNGTFQFSFVVPRDIRIPIGNGKISFYAKNNNPLFDKTGYDTSILIGGVNTAAVRDITPPRVRLYMNNESFINGGITNASPFFLAYMEDENGMNTASGIGHDMVAVLDGNESNPYILNDYYDTTLNDYTHGKIRYPFRNLAVGLHTIIFRAWDVYNNPVSATIQFVVADDASLTLSNVLNYPNPFTTYTQFWFSHNKPYEPLEVQVQVMTLTGKVVWSRNQTIYNEGFLSKEISWDGRDDFGERIGKGVYIYKLYVRSTLNNQKSEKIEKLVIL